MEYLRNALLFLLTLAALTLHCAYDLYAAEDPGNLFQNAEALFKDKKYTEALPLYELFITKASSSTKGYRGIVRCYSALGDSQGAVVFMESLFLEKPESAGVCYGLGYALYNAKKYKNAKTYFEKAVRIDPDLAEAWNNCAVIYHFYIHDYEKAQKYYERAITTASKTGNKRVLEVARNNLSHLPVQEKLTPVNEKLTLEEFINRLISSVNEKDENGMRRLISGQKENSEQAMDWLLEQDMHSDAQGKNEDESTTILLARLLEREYRRSFKSNFLLNKLDAYEGLSDENKKMILYGEDLLREGLKMERDGAYGEAESSYKNALLCFEGIKDNSRAGLAHVYLGDIYRKIKKYPLARDAYEKGLTCFNKTGEKEKKASVFSSLGITCFRMGDYQDAGDFLARSLELYRLLGDEEEAKRVKRDMELIKAQGKRQVH
jgi:tetratricopeptide (TPR) repeat protein